MKIFTKSTCDRLLIELANPEFKKQYSNDKFDLSLVEYVPMEYFVKIPDTFVLDAKAEADMDNSIKIFELMKDLDRVQANDKRLWITLTHTVFFKYSKDRWQQKNENSDEKILRRFYYEGASLEARMRNSVSRLWWSAKLTYDTGFDDPYFLTRLLWSKQDIYQNLVERSYGTYESVLKGFLEYYSLNSNLKEADLRRLFTALNAIGGVKVLSIHSKDEIKMILKDLAKYYKLPSVA